MTDSPPHTQPEDDTLAFVLVPTLTARHDGWSPDRQRAFIAALAQIGGVAAAARAVGMTPQSANRLRRREGAESFAAAWAAALEEGRMRNYDRALSRGRYGYFVPLRRNGKIVGHRHRYDNRLLFAACYGEPPTRPERR